LYDPHTTPHHFSTALLTIPSLAPDLLGEFSEATCLNTGRAVGGNMYNEGEAYNDSFSGSRRIHQVVSGHVAVMAAAGMTQVVETELLTAGVVESIKVSLTDIMCFCVLPFVFFITCRKVFYTSIYLCKHAQINKNFCHHVFVLSRWNWELC
jgi:hypothetical protein